MGGARPRCPGGGFQSRLAPHSRAWKPRLELKGLEVTQLRDQVPVTLGLQTPMDNVGGTNILPALQFAPRTGSGVPSSCKNLPTHRGKIVTAIGVLF